MSFLFVINSSSGNSEINYKKEIEEYLQTKSVEFQIYELPNSFNKEDLKQEIKNSNKKIIVAVGGDGTIKLIAELIHTTEKILGIIPAGSANGMAKELNIPINDIPSSIDLLLKNEPIKIHLVKVNQEICIHLADLGFNAYLVKKFDTLPQRGMWGYAKSAVHALINHEKLNVEIEVDGKFIKSQAAMLVIANATMYGTGVKINPDGKLNDDYFELVVIKKYSYLEVLKIWLTRLPFNPKKIEVFQTKSVKITSLKKAHLQVDGEYLGKTKEVKAFIIPDTLNIITGKLICDNEL